MVDLGISSFRIEGATYSAQQLREIIISYQQAMNRTEVKDDMLGGLEPIYAGYTLGSLQFN